jgi:predicted ATPase
MLLLIDNFEHLLEGAELLGEILIGASYISLLVTSRERLGLQEECIYDVQGLPFPQEVEITTGKTVDFLENFDAVRLFFQGARRAKTGFSVSNEDILAIVRLCQLVDGMPLGLELAAPWVRSMTCQEIVEEVEKDLDFLSTTLRNVPGRHRSLRAIYEQTWSQLPKSEQITLSKMSVFRGGCYKEAAEQVADASLPLLSSLVEKALLRRGRAGRYEMHELIRQFAVEKLQDQPDIYEETLDRHADYFADFLHQWRVYLSGRGREGMVNEITADIDNVNAAWQRAVVQRNVGVLDRSAEPLYGYYHTKSLFHEVEAALRQATSAIIDSVDSDDGYDVEEADKLPDRSKKLFGYLLALLGHTCNMIGWLDKGQTFLEQGIMLQRRAEPRDKRREAVTLLSLSFSFHWGGKFAKAEPILHEALELYTEVQDRTGIAWCMNRLGSAALQSGRPGEAERLLLESKKIAEEVGNAQLLSTDYQILGMKAIDCGDYTLAQEHLDTSENIIREDIITFDLAGTMRERSRLYLAQGRYAQAAKAIQRSLELFDEGGSKWHKEATLSYLGSLYRQQEDFKKAERFYRQSLSAAEEVNHLKLIAHNLSALGCVYFDQGQYHQAKQYQLKALDIFSELENEPEMASVYRHLGYISISLEDNRQDKSSKYYQKALRLSKKHLQAPIALDVFVGWSYHLVRVGEATEAVELLTMAKQHPASTFETKEKAGEHRDKLAGDLPADVFTASQSIGQTLELWETATKYLDMSG